MEFRVLGPLEVSRDGEVRTPAGVKERTILARLLLEPCRAVPAETLIDAAWPEADPVAAARSLGVRLANLRAFLEPGRRPGAPSSVLVRDGGGYRLVAKPEHVDAVRLGTIVGGAAALPPAEALTAYETALSLWRGAPFGDVAYAEFAQDEIRRLEALRVRAAVGRGRALVELGRHEEALPELQRLAAAEPLGEELQRSLAVALYRCGRQVDALAALRDLGATLAELGLEPSTETRELERAILVHDRSLAAPAPAVRRLPARASRFFGREDDLAHVEQLVAESPLVTIAGTGGAGKTRLALELAERHGDAWWCELAPVADDGDVPGVIADVLGDGDRGLLVLDNCEHVLDGAAAAVEDLLRRAPDLRLLATSRAPLGVDGERVMRLCGLEPAAAGDMFVDRVQAAGGMIDRAAIGELCRRLDGLPLAIELAAGRTRSMAPADIVARLDERFSLLTVTGRRSASRHSTLRDAIAWSYDLLDEPQRRLFERLSVFARDCTLDDAEAVCSAPGVERAQVAALLDELVAHSLVVARQIGGRTRYSLLETLREYGAERLAARGEADLLHERHANHYVARAARMAEGGYVEPRLPLVDEFDELRAAVRWCERDERADRAFTLVEALWWIAMSRHGEEIARLVEETLERWRGVHALRVRALGAASVVRLVVGDVGTAQRHAEAAIALEAGLGEAALIARRTLAHIAFFGGDLMRAAVRWHDLAWLARAAGYDALACEANGFTVQLLHADGQYDAAAALAAGMRHEAERLQAPVLVAWSRYVSGVTLLEHDPIEARRWLEEALALAREADHHHMIRFSLRALGIGAGLRGDHAEAAARLLAALEHDEARSDAASQWTTLRAIGGVLVSRGRWEAAAELLAATEGWPAAPFLAALAARARERVAERSVALAGRRTLDLDAAKALARAELRRATRH